MQVIETVENMRRARAGRRRVACVPTMGNLHEGHMSLVRLARERGDTVVATLFVNRLQFAPHEDFDSYPRTFEADCAKLSSAGVDFLFAPGEAELYPEPQSFMVDPPAALAATLEGEFRPGFFRGVATVVSKLFNIVAPEVAVFGKKDYQQLLVIRAMVRHLAWPIAIVAGETVRATDGLALSSRNSYLSIAERREAPRLHQTLLAVESELRRRQGTPREIEGRAMNELREKDWRPDYVAVRRQGDLQPSDRPEGDLVVLAAAWLGSTRLIDNIEVTL